MPDIEISAEGNFDLVEIWLYTDEHFGTTQADRYLDQLSEAMDKLVTHPELGKDRSDVKTGYRHLHVNKHLIFYRPINDGSLLVVRVLHDSMDVLLHL